jgi:tetratricopeptide (TPR) repeat protein
MRFRLLPFVLAAFPLITWAADDCNGAPPYECAVTLVQRGRFPAAIDLLEKLTAESPQNLKALNLLGIALSGAGNLEKANARFRQALQADPAFLSALENLSINEFALGHADQAKADLETVLKNNPNDEVAHVYLGEIAFGMKQYGEAAAHYEKGRAKVYPVIMHYAECLLKTGRKDDLSAVLRALPAEDTEKQLQAGILLGNAEAYGEAVPYFGRARVHASDPYPAAYDQTLMLIRGGDYPAAIQLSGELFTAGLRRAELYNLVSEAYVKTGQVEKAYHALRTATELEPEAEDNYVDFAGICLDNTNYELGLEIVDIGLKHLPNSYRLHLHRGLLLAHQGLTEESEKDFEIASRLSPSQSLPYVALGLAWMQRGDTAKAVAVLRARVKSYPNDFMLPYILGIALSRSDAEAGGEARAAFEASVRLNPRFSPARAQLGKQLLKSGDVGGAVEQLETAVKLDPEDATAAYQLGQAYRRMGDGARAQEMLARVVKLRHQKDETDPQIDPNGEMQRLIRAGAASGEHTVAK